MAGYTRVDTSNNIADGNVISATDLDNEFDGVQAAFSASTGHTHGGGVGEGAPITKIGPTQDVTASAFLLAPKTTNTIDLGSSSLKYKDLWLAGNANFAGTTTLGSALTYGGVTLNNAVTGTGNMVLSSSPTLVTPTLGTPASVTLTNATGLPVSTGISGLGTGVAGALATNVGTAGAPVINGGALGTPASGVVTNLTGTASININGTVGATTASTGAFTTLTTSSTVTLNGGTANGVAYLNGSKVLTTGSALTFDGTNLGVGVASPLTKLHLQDNGPVYIQFTDSGDGASRIGQNGTALTFGVDASNGTTEQMRLTSTGLGIGTSSPAVKLVVSNAGANGYEFDPANNYISSYNRSTSAWTAVTFRASGYTFNINNSFDALKLDSSGNLGLGVNPSAWGSNWRAINFGFNTGIGQLAATSAGSGDVTIVSAAYNNNTNWLYYYSGVAASRYSQIAGNHQWYTAPSGTAGNAITFTQAMTLASTGNLLVGSTSDSGSKLQVGSSSGSVSTPTAIELDGTYASSNAFNKLKLYLYKGASESYGMGIGAAADMQYWAGSSSTGVHAWYTSQTERARITASGNLLVGKTSFVTTTNGFQINGDSGSSSFGSCASTLAATGNTNTTYEVYSSGAGAFRFYVGMAGTVFATSTTISAISDQRLKENVQDLDVGLDAVMALKPRKFDWKAGKGKDIKGDRGWIAQEFEQVFPDMIDEWRDPSPEGDEPYKSVRADLIPVLVKAIQEQQAIITTLTARVAALESN